MEVRIEELPAFTVAAAKARSPKPDDVGAAWAKLIGWLGSARATAETPVGAGIGITEGKPGARGQKYEAAWPVDEGSKGDRTIRIKSTPEGTYAMTTFEGSPAEADGIYQQILEDWLPGSEFKLEKGPVLTLHRSALLDAVQTIDVCLPVSAK